MFPVTEELTIDVRCVPRGKKKKKSEDVIETHPALPPSPAPTPPRLTSKSSPTKWTRWPPPREQRRGRIVMASDGSRLATLPFALCHRHDQEESQEARQAERVSGLRSPLGQRAESGEGGPLASPGWSL